MIRFDIDDEFESFMREVLPHVAEHSTEYRVMRDVFFAGCAVTSEFYMQHAFPSIDTLKALQKVHDQINEFSKRPEREDFDV
jgi:hypothetical protein